ncbi:hypothetical protein SAMN04489724_2131 [Algoriphagus locisalis]|uniref:TonB-dependent Receptor Plug Domain n=1 Tax=Algoriphagus locisalis TaxID=305507 RepID=A0A1I7AQA1_9BACT|nr:hypothetical protein [Algoriphagus locisalis]SFT77084.1 hypothetical protein SAMN04489724_2131 [Algoriphagus locisalis]
MKSLIIISLILTICFPGFCQNSEPAYGIGMTSGENLAWLTSLKDTTKQVQLTMIQNRFFKPTRPMMKSDNEDLPVMVVDGIPISLDINEGVRNFLANELIADNVEIEVLDKEPEELYANKRWTGLILLNITNNKTRKKMYKNK